jgi:heme-degrading monooxygenase HmoA
MICALTVRSLKPGAFDAFRTAFMTAMNPDDPGDGWVRFNMVRNAEKPDEVITFGFFDGTVEELRSGAEAGGYADLLAAIAPHVESVGTDGLFEVVEDLTL